GPELLVRLAGPRRRALLEDRLRELIREGSLSADSRLPSSRVLAGDLGVSRRLVVDAYAELLAEGYLVSRRGDGTYVAATSALAGPSCAPAPPRELRFDFFPGIPDLSFFPRSLRLRAALSGYLRRVRGVLVDPDAIVVCAGATQGLALLARALTRAGVSEIA